MLSNGREMPEGLFLTCPELVSSRFLPKLSLDLLFDPAQSFIASGLSDFTKRTLIVGNSLDHTPNVYFPLDVAEVSSIEARARVEELKKGVRRNPSCNRPFR